VEGTDRRAGAAQPLLTELTGRESARARLSSLLADGALPVTFFAMKKTDHQLAAFAAHEVLMRGETTDPVAAARRGAQALRVTDGRIVAIVIGHDAGRAMKLLREYFSADLSKNASDDRALPDRDRVLNA